MVAAFVAAGFVAAGFDAAGFDRSAMASHQDVPGIPTIYVSYDFATNCTFSLTVDGGITVTATSPPGPTLPPGGYQIRVYMPNPATGYTCGAPQFTLRGPGVNSVTTFPYESLLDDHVLPNLQPSSTYVAEDENAPTATRVYFTTSATGTSTSLLAGTTGAQGATGSESSTDVVGSAIPPYRGKLSASVSRTGKAAVKLLGKAVNSLKAGRYDVTVADATRVAGFSLEKAGGKPIRVTTPIYVGKKTRRVTLTAGKWMFFAKNGAVTRFVVRQ